MKTDYNYSDLEKILYSVIDTEKEPVMHSNRVESIMDKVYDLNTQASFESQRFTLRTAVIYGLSIAASICIGCIIGNMVDLSSVVITSSAQVGVDYINVGFGGFILPI